MLARKERSHKTPPVPLMPFPIRWPWIVRRHAECFAALAKKNGAFSGVSRLDWDWPKTCMVWHVSVGGGGTKKFGKIQLWDNLVQTNAPTHQLDHSVTDTRLFACSMLKPTVVHGLLDPTSWTDPAVYSMCIMDSPFCSVQIKNPAKSGRITSVVRKVYTLQHGA